MGWRGAVRCRLCRLWAPALGTHVATQQAAAAPTHTRARALCEGTHMATQAAAAPAHTIARALCVGTHVATQQAAAVPAVQHTQGPGHIAWVGVGPGHIMWEEASQSAFWSALQSWEGGCQVQVGGTGVRYRVGARYRWVVQESGTGWVVQVGQVQGGCQVSRKQTCRGGRQPGCSPGAQGPGPRAEVMRSGSFRAEADSSRLLTCTRVAGRPPRLPSAAEAPAATTPVGSAAHGCSPGTDLRHSTAQ